MSNTSVRTTIVVGASHGLGHGPPPSPPSAISPSSRLERRRHEQRRRPICRPFARVAPCASFRRFPATPDCAAARVGDELVANAHFGCSRRLSGGVGATELGSLASFVGYWLPMMAAMMLPGAVALGVMSTTWMSLIAALVLAQKLVPEHRAVDVRIGHRGAWYRRYRRPLTNEGDETND